MQQVAADAADIVASSPSTLRKQLADQGADLDADWAAAEVQAAQTSPLTTTGMSSTTTTPHWAENLNPSRSEKRLCICYVAYLYISKLNAPLKSNNLVTVARYSLSSAEQGLLQGNCVLHQQPSDHVHAVVLSATEVSGTSHCHSLGTNATSHPTNLSSALCTTADDLQVVIFLVIYCGTSIFGPMQP